MKRAHERKKLAIIFCQVSVSFKNRFVCFYDLYWLYELLFVLVIMIPVQYDCIDVFQHAFAFYWDTFIRLEHYFEMPNCARIQFNSLRNFYNLIISQIGQLGQSSWDVTG